MKIRDIPPGQFFSNKTLTYILWFKIGDWDNKSCAIIVDDHYKRVPPSSSVTAQNYSLSRWQFDYENDEYEIIPPEDV